MSLKSTIINGLFSVLMAIFIFPNVVSASAGASARNGKNFSFIIMGFGIIYISAIAWYLHKKTGQSSELSKELENYALEAENMKINKK